MGNCGKIAAGVHCAASGSRISSKWGSRMLSGAQSLLARQPLAAGRHRPGKAAAAPVAHPCQAAMLQMADRRLHARMALAAGPEPVLTLMRRSRPAQAALARQRALLKHRAEQVLIGRRVEALVETARDPRRKSRLRPGDHRHRAVGAAAGPQNLMMQDELMLILDNAHRHAQLLRHTRLALGHPPGVRLKDREHFFRMRDILAPERPPPDRVDLNPRLLGKIPCRLSLGQLRLAQVQAGAHPVRRLSHPAVRLPDISGHMAMLAPRRQPQIIAPRSHGAHRVPQQILGRREVDARLGHKAVSAPAQGVARLFFGAYIPNLTRLKYQSMNSQKKKNIE